MSWNISESDKSKMELSIANETARLDFCREALNKLKKEYEIKKNEYTIKLVDLKDKIHNIEKSIASGEKFISECNEHLKTFEN